MAAGATVTGITPMCAERELAGQLMDCEASILVAAPELMDVARRAGVRQAVPLGEIEGEGAAPAVALEPARAVALLAYSSGTTGLPKGVMLTHANVVAGVGQVRAALKLGPRDTVVAVAPFAHVMGFVITMASALASGATLVTLAQFAFEPYLELVERHRATVLIGPPPVMAALAGHPAVDARDLSSVELVVAGGAPVPAEIARAVGERLPGAVVRLGYGLTETAATATAPDRELAVAPGSVGRAMPSTELRVVDPQTGADLGPGEPGELLVRGPQTMVGYLHRPDATAAMIDGDGWLRTGDLVVIDEEGQVFVVDRLKVAHQGQRLPGRARGARGRARHASGGRRRRRRRARRRRQRRGPRRGRRRPRRARPRGPHGVGGGARRALQAHPRGALRRRDPAHAGGQDPAPGAGRARAPGGVSYSSSRQTTRWQ
jgi:acyl-CoA synthetase (AMP-forming)/AMP-acid ligase II